MQVIKPQLKFLSKNEDNFQRFENTVCLIFIKDHIYFSINTLLSHSFDENI